MPPKQIEPAAKAPPPPVVQISPEPLAVVEQPPVDKPPENSGPVEKADSQQPDPPPEGWHAMATAPSNRPIWITGDPASDPGGTLSFWRITREKNRPGRGWSPKAFWAAVLTRRELDFEPACWKESSQGAALAAALEAESEAA